MHPQPTRLLEQAYQSTHPARTLIRLLNITPWQILAYLVINLVKTSPLLLIPLYLEWMVAYAKDPTSSTLTMFWLVNIGFIALCLQNIWSHQLFVTLAHRHVRGMEHGLRAALIRRMQQLSISWHVRAETGRLQSKVLRDVDSMVQMSMHVFHMGINVFLTLIWAIYLTFSRDPMIGTFFIIGTPIAASMIGLFRRRMRAHNKAYRGEMEAMSSRVSEMIDTIPITRAHGIEDHEIERSESYLGQVYHAGLRIDKTNHLFGAASWASMQIAVTVVVASATWLVVGGHMPLESIMLYYSLFGIVVQAQTQLLGFMPVISAGFEGMRSVGEVLECPDLEWNHGKRRVDSVQGDIAFKDVRFVYEDGTLALDHLNLEIHSGECVAFVGESGSGKSTAMNCAIGFYRPQGGHILLDGIDQRELDLRTWRRQIAVVPQHTILFSGSLRENITYGLDDIAEERVQAAITAANLCSVIEQLPEGLETKVGENGMTLSGGQRQRVAIARALVRDPRIIILDEATSALDVISEKEVQEAIDNLIEGRTVLIVAHRLSTIRKADRVVVMKNGRCIELGTQEELIGQGGEFSRLKRLQA